MAYIHCTKEFLSDDYCMRLLSKNGISISNQRPTAHDGIWAFDVSGDIIPETDKQITITIYANEEIEIEVL